MLDFDFCFVFECKGKDVIVVVFVFCFYIVLVVDIWVVVDEVVYGCFVDDVIWVFVFEVEVID